MRKFTLFDFPKDRVYVVLEKTFREKFFNEAIKVAGSQNALARKLKVSDTMIKNWRRGNNGIYEQAIPLWVIIQMYVLLNSRKFSLNKIQKAVIKYRARGGFPVIKPNLPLIEDERLIRIFFHMAGDGFAGHFKGAKPNYFNKNKEVMKEFINDLSVFGKVKINLRENGRRLEFPKVIAHILQYIYQTNFKSEEVKIPPQFFKLKKEIILQGIKAIMDDEATVESNRIRIALKNKSFLSDIAKLLRTKASLGNCIVFFTHSPKIFGLRINSKGLKLYNQNIGFTHSKKKKALNFYLNKKFNLLKIKK